MTLVKAPFTQGQVELLNRFQRLWTFHPFTCGEDSTVLVATVDGWVCPTCDWTQGWAHDFMLDEQFVAGEEHAKEQGW